MAIKTRRGKLYPPVEFEYAAKLGIDEIEWERIVDRLGRPPNHFECTIFATLWSEAVSNKSSSSLLETIERKDQDVIRVPGSRVGLVNIGEDQYLALRVVQNNKQSYREPYWGAQTALDQSLEDLTAIGARPLGLMNLLRFGSPELIKTQRMFQSVVDGVSSYGNKFGTPIVGGELYFHSRYSKGLMVNSGVVGVLESSNSLKRSDAPYQSPVLYVGAPTGRDALLNKQSVENSMPGAQYLNQTITVGDPLLSTRLISAIAEAVELDYVREVVALGPGGLAVGCFDLSSRVNKPIFLDIDKVPLRGQDSFEPLEIILSESTERLLVVTTKDKHRALVNLFHKWDIDSVRVGELNDSDGIEFYWNHYIAADIPFQFALGGSVQKHINVVKFPPMLKRKEGSDQADKMRKRKRKVDDEWSLVREIALTQDGGDDERELDCPNNLEDVWLDLLANPNLCSRQPMYEMFDQVVGANTIVRPGCDATVLRLSTALRSNDHINRVDELNDSEPVGLPNRGVALTFDSNSLYVSMEPYLGTVQTIAEGMRNLAATGARPIGLAHCLNFGSPENYREICDLSEAIRGLGDATRIWNIPILSETVSLYNGTEGSPILPTPAILMAGIVLDVTKVCRIGFREKGDKIFLLGLTKNEIGCSEYAHYFHKRVNRLVPDIDFDGELKICSFVLSLIESGLARSVHDVSAGGTAVALVECCLERKAPLGATLHIDPQVFETPNGPVSLRRDAALFAESSGRFIVSCAEEDEETLRDRCAETGIPITGSGTVGGKTICIKGAAEVELPLSTTYRLWVHRLAHLLGYRSDETVSL